MYRVHFHLSMALFEIFLQYLCVVRYRKIQQRVGQQATSISILVAVLIGVQSNALDIWVVFERQSRIQDANVLADNPLVIRAKSNKFLVHSSCCTW